MAAWALDVFFAARIELHSSVYCVDCGCRLAMNVVLMTYVKPGQAARTDVHMV